MSFGIIQFQILSGTPTKLPHKENFFILATPPPAISKAPQMRTTALAQEDTNGLNWNFSRDIVLTGQIHTDTSMSLSLWQKNKVLSDRKLAVCDVSLETLARGNSIEATDFSFNNAADASEELAQVTLKIGWKDGQVPEGLVAAGDGGGEITTVDPTTGEVTTTQQPMRSGMARPPGQKGPMKPLPACKDQDFSVRIWFHRATNLQSLKEDKLYNPQAVAEVCGKSHRTDVVKDTLDPRFDEEVTFTFQKVKETFWSEPIQLTINNHRLGPSETIGTVVLDMATVYRSSPQHFMQRKWLILHKSASEGNVMGFLKVSVAVLNMRTDPFPEVDEEDDDEDSNDEAAIANLVSSGGSVFEEVQLWCELIRAEGIPQMDAGVGGTADPYVRLLFGKRTANSVNVRNTLNPVWNTHVTLPLTLPSLTSTISVQLWDYDATSADDLNGTVQLNLHHLMECGKDGMPYLPAQWINYYGHPRPCDADFNSYFKKMAKGEKKGIDYRGRMLLRMIGFSGHGQPSLPPIRETVVEVCVSVQLMQFNMIPDSGKYKVRVSMGRVDACTLPKDTTPMHGVKDLHSVYYGSQLEFKAKFSVIAPEDEVDAAVVTQIPDVLIQLVEDGSVSQQLSALNPLAAITSTGRGETEPYASCRFTYKSVIEKSAKGDVFYKCKAMRRSVDYDKTAEGRPPANPIGQIVLGTFFSQSEPEHPNVPISRSLAHWPQYVDEKPMEKYVLEACLYQGRQIPAGDSTGLSDPFVRVSWANASASSGVKHETLNPIYNEMLRITADTKQKFPDIVVEIWDWDLVGRNTFLCKSVISFDDIDADDGHLIKWFDHFTDSYGNRCHDCALLLSFSVMKGTPAVLNQELPKVPMLKQLGKKDTYMGIPVPRDRAIPTARYSFDLNFYALRHMRKFRLRELQRPTVEMALSGYNLVVGRAVGANPDLNAGLKFTVELPEDPKYFPQIVFRVFDQRIGPRVLVGTSTVSTNSSICNPTAKADAKKTADDKLQQTLQHLLEAKTKLLQGEKLQRSNSVVYVDPPEPKKKTLGQRVRGISFKKKETTINAAPADVRTAKDTGDMNQPLLDGNTPKADEAQELGSQETNISTTTEPAEPTLSAKITNDELEDALATAFAPPPVPPARPDSPTLSETSTEPDEELWFDRYDPEGLEADIDPTIAVSRLGKLKVLPAGYTTCEDHFGPFNDNETEINFNRGWGKRSVKAGTALLDINLVRTSDSAEPTQNPVPVPLATRETQPYLLRVYVLNCRNLAAMDDGPLGKSSDPYVTMKLHGSASSKEVKTLKFKDEGKFQTLNPDYFFMKEVSADLPRYGLLTLTVFDYDKIGFDEEIGSTEINLQQRWYSCRGYQHQQDGSLRPGSYTETRTLRNKSGQVQGQIELWIDMFDPTKPTGIPRPIDITPPPPVELEIRAVIWNTRDVVLVDNSLIGGEKMTDIYVRCWLEGMRNDVQNTDVHYRSLDGTGNFNWRMNYRCVLEPRTKKIFPVDSGSALSSLFHIRKEQKKFAPILHCQIFDNDLLPGTDDFIGESSIDLMGVNPVTTRRDQQSFLGLITGDVTSCCNCWPLNKCPCCTRETRQLSLAERQQLALKEATAERRAKEKEWTDNADEKIKVLRQTNKYNEDQLKAMRRKIMKQQRKASVTNVLEAFLPQKRKKNAPPPVAKPVAPVHETGKFWIACRGPFGGGRVGDVQVSFQVVRVDALEKDKESLAAGKGRSDPQKLPEPDRPDSSFFWLSSPWKSAVHILWKNYKWYIFTVVCLVIWAVVVYLFLTTGLEVKAKEFFSKDL